MNVADAGNFQELPRLFQSVLAGDGIDYQQSFVGRARNFASRYALHLFQLSHQIRLVMQAPCGIDDQDIRAARLRSFHRIEQDRRRIRSLLLLNQRHAGALGPDRQLVAGRGAKGVGCANQNIVAFGFDSLRQLANRRRLADAVHADNHHHIGRDVVRHGRFGSDSVFF